MHFKLADANDAADFDFPSACAATGRGRAPPARAGRRRRRPSRTRPSTRTRVTFGYDGDLKRLADHVEDVRGAEVLSLGHTLEIIKDLGDAETVAERLRARRVHRHARHRPRADGDRVRRRHLRRAPVLGVSVLRRRRRPQRPAHELPPVAPAPGAPRPPLPVRVRLRDHRRLPRRADGKGDRSRRPCRPRRARRRLHLHLRHRGRLGVAKDEMAAKPLVLYESDDLVALASEEIAIRAVIDREIETYDPYEGEVMVWIAVAGTERSCTTRAASPSRRRRVPRLAESTASARVRRERPHHAHDQPRLRRLIYEEGISDVTIQNPGARHSLGVGILHALQITSRARSAISAAGSSTGRRSTSRAASAGRRREHDVRRRRGRERRLADGRRPARRRPRHQGPGRRPHGHRPEGRHDHRRSATPAP